MKNKRYTVLINGYSKSNGLKNKTYLPGKEVVFRVPFVYDVSIYVTTNDVKLNCHTTDWDYVYSFIMPENNVNINIKMASSMMNKNYFNEQGEGDNDCLLKLSYSDHKETNQEKIAGYCIECGYPYPAGKNFCGQCGRNLKSK